MKFTIATLTILALTVPCSAAVIYVDSNAPSGNNGSNWNDAYATLTAALDHASYGDQIKVAQGTYLPDTTGLTYSQDATFQLVDGVAISGGYAGLNAKHPDMRDINFFKTILSGDLMANDSPDNQNTEDNTRHVVTGSGTGPMTVLDGLVINAGIGTFNGSFGGGIYIAAGSPTISRCVFTNIRGMRGYSGSAIYAKDSSNPVITNCVFQGGHLSGGTLCETPAVQTITNCIFLDCIQGAIMQFGGVPVIANCIFTQCQWAMYLDYSNADIRNCLFFDNDEVVVLDGQAEPVFTGCIYDSPLFVNRYGGDYHLQQNSPCIDSGDNSPVSTDAIDLDGNQRVINGTVDIGAYESVQSIAVNMNLTPKKINCSSNRKWIKAHFTLPEGYEIEDVDTFRLATIELFSIASDHLDVLYSNERLVEVTAFFPSSEICQIGLRGLIELSAGGWLTDGMRFTGTDMIRVE